MVRTPPHLGDPLLDAPPDRQSKVFEPSTIELRFQYLSQAAERPGGDRDGFIPVTVRVPTPEDGPSCVPCVFIFSASLPERADADCPLSIGLATH